MQRLLFLVDQPWQLQLSLGVIEELATKGFEYEVAFAITDYYIFLHHPELIKSIDCKKVHQIFTLEEEYRSWQQNLREEADEAYILDWDNRFCKVRNILELERTNQWVYGDERSRYYLPISGQYRKIILLDTIKWVDCIVENWLPTTIVAVERSTLPTNLIWTRSESEKIKFLTFIPSRIGNRWSLRKDFGYGMSPDLEFAIREKYSSPGSTSEAEELVSRIISKKQGSYLSLEFKETAVLQQKTKQPLRGLLADLKVEIKNVYSRTFLETRRRAFKVRRVEQDLFKLSVVRLQRIFIHFFYNLGNYKYAHMTTPLVPYYFWGLHARPEGSVLALGNGRDEISELTKAIDHLPTGSLLVVKENIEMLGLRRRGFYKTLRANPKIWLLDATSNTFDAMYRSQGVIGISGTLLLEAKMLKKTVCALGNPEFLPFLDYTSRTIDLFFNAARSAQEVESSFREFLKYVQYILDTSSESDVPIFHHPLTDLESQQMIERFAKIIFTELENSLL